MEQEGVGVPLQYKTCFNTFSFTKPLLANECAHDGPDRITPVFPHSIIHVVVVTVPHALAHHPDQAQLCIGLQIKHIVISLIDLENKRVTAGES